MFSVTVTAIVYLLFMATAFGEERLALDKFVDVELENAQRAMVVVHSPPASASGGEAWYFRRTLLRVRPKIGFDVEFGKLQVIPEVEIVWQRKLPEGWEIYTPK